MNKQLQDRMDALGIYELALLLYAVSGYLDGNEEFEHAVQANIGTFEHTGAAIFETKKQHEDKRNQETARA